MTQDTDKRRNRGSLADPLRRETWLADLAAADPARPTRGGVLKSEEVAPPHTASVTRAD